MDTSQTRCFWQNKADCGHDNLLTYPNFTETFKIHSDASAFKVEVVIIQRGKLIAFIVENWLIPQNGTY